MPSNNPDMTPGPARSVLNAADDVPLSLSDGAELRVLRSISERLDGLERAVRILAYGGGDFGSPPKFSRARSNRMKRSLSRPRGPKQPNPPDVAFGINSADGTRRGAVGYRDKLSGVSDTLSGVSDNLSGMTRGDNLTEQETKQKKQTENIERWFDAQTDERKEELRDLKKEGGRDAIVDEYKRERDEFKKWGSEKEDGGAKFKDERDAYDKWREETAAMQKLLEDQNEKISSIQEWMERVWKEIFSPPR